MSALQNTVYISALQEHLVIADNKLHLMNRPNSLNRAIYLFMHALACEQLDNKAIAYILLGAAYGGVKGTGAIKAASG